MNISGKAGFSRRELRVIALLAKGATTQDLVAKLGVKKPVVLNYIHFAYKKAGVRTRPISPVFNITPPSDFSRSFLALCYDIYICLL